MKAIRYRNQDHACQHGLIVKETKTKIHVIFMEPGIKVRKLPKTELRYMTDLDYPTAKLKRKLKEAGKGWQWTDEAGNLHNKVTKATKECLR